MCFPGCLRFAVGRKSSLSLDRCRDTSRVRMLRRPIFRRKCHAPKCRRRRGKFQSNFRFTRSHRAKECHVALLFFFGGVVVHQHLGSARQPGLQKNQGAVRIDRQRRGLFFKCFTLRVRAANPHCHLHQYSLAASAWTRMSWGILHLAHRTSYISIYPGGKESRAARKRAYTKRLLVAQEQAG